MKVFVVGANGQIGKQLVNLLNESDEHTVRAMVRSEEQAENFRKLGVEAKLVDLEGSVRGHCRCCKRLRCNRIHSRVWQPYWGR